MKQWHTLEGRKIEDLTNELIMLSSDGEERKINIGTDSQKHGTNHEFVTCVVILKPGKGGRVFYTKEKHNKKFSLREKLFKEAYMSVETAMELNPAIPEDWEIIVHLDVNPNTKFKSSEHVKQLVGLVVGQGFEAVIKPFAWCSSHVSEHLVKHRHER